jgi:hypothetical protein
LLGLLLDSEDEAVFLRNVGLLSTDYMALYPKRQNPSSYNLLSMVAKKRPVTLSKINMKSSKIFGPYNERETKDKAQEAW